MTRRVALLVVLGACSGDKPASRPESPRAAADPPTKVAPTPAEDRTEMCTAFADRVLQCAPGGSGDSAGFKLTDRETSEVWRIAHEVCMHTSEDEAALHYYGDVDKKIACMKDKQQCLDVMVCLTRDGTPENP